MTAATAREVMTMQGAEENSDQKPLLVTASATEGTAGRPTNGTLRRHEEYLWNGKYWSKNETFSSREG